MLAAVAWANPNGGAWDVAGNWSTGVVPGPGDDVIINTAAAETIAIQPGDSISVNSLTTGTNDTLSVSGGSLTVATVSTLSGPLTMTGGSLTATGSGGSLTSNGSTSIADASLYAEAGGTLSLPQLTSYASNATTLEANGGSSVLSLSALVTIVHVGSLSINADGGGKIDFSSLKSLAGSGNPEDLRLNDIGRKSATSRN